MTTKTCPQCGKEARGNFCSFCGGSLGGVHCSNCGEQGEPGGRFCNACGAPLAVPTGGGTAEGAARRSGSGGGGAGVAGSQAAWWVVGGLMVVLILVVGLDAVRSNDQPVQGPPGAGGGAAGPTNPADMPATTDITNMTPREAADSLFNRVMRVSSAGDSAQVVFFLPMAIASYERAQPLDADGLFHLSLLHRTGGDPASGLEVAEEALAAHPDHLLNLASAAGAAAEMGDTARAREHYRHLLDVWDAEMAKELQEYQGHSNMMPELKREAETFLAESG